MWQKILFIGNLGKDPEMRYSPAGEAVTSFSVAVTDGFGDKKTTVWFRVSAWGKLAETTNQFLKRGSRVLVEGRLTPDKETGSPRVFQRQDGTTGASYEVSASTVRFLSPKDEQPDGDDNSEIPF